MRDIEHRPLREIASLFKVSTQDFTENAKEIQEQVLALQAAELAVQRAGDQLDRLRSGVTQTAAAQANPQTPQTPTQPAAPQQCRR